MTHTWVNYGDGSAVQASKQAVADLAKQKIQTIPMHQGAEETILSGRLAQFTAYDGTISPAYNNARGDQDARAAFAGFAEHFLGLPAMQSNTFVLQANGRVGLGHAFHFAAKPFLDAYLDPIAILPNARWPMVDDKAKQQRLRISHAYDIARGATHTNIIQSLTEAKQEITKRYPAAVYTNFPHNPSGYQSNPMEIGALQDHLDHINTDQDTPPVMHVVDDPYFAGLSHNENGTVLKSPYAGQFKMDSPTPSMHVISLSKALGMARPGVTGIVITNSEIAQEFAKYIASGEGCSFSPGLMHNVTEMLQPEFYPDLKEHFAALRAKYVRNGKILEATLKDHLMDGDHGMVRTLILPEDSMGKNIIDPAGGLQHIKTNRDVAAYIMNVHNVATVAQGTNGIRIALKAENSDVIQAGVTGIASSIEELQAAPLISMP